MERSGIEDHRRQWTRNYTIRYRLGFLFLHGTSNDCEWVGWHETYRLRQTSIPLRSIEATTERSPVRAICVR